MRVLVVEDEPKMAALIRRVLTAERHVVDLAPDGAAASRSPPSDYDVIVLDRMLPDLDGVAVLRLLRAEACARRCSCSRRSARSIIAWAVSTRAPTTTCPSPSPSPSCWPASARSAAGRRAEAARLVAGDLELDELRHVAQVGDRTVDLSAREFALLGYLIRHAGQVLTRRQILDAVWGAEPDVYSNVVDLYVHYLRRKLGELGRADRLRTVRGVGYSLRADA